MNTATRPILPPSVNYHLNAACNFACRYCYAEFADTIADTGRGQLPVADALRIIDAVADAGCVKLTFAGGEPTLYPGLVDLVRHAHGRGLVTMLVTNGSRLSERYLNSIAPYLDWLTLSIDSGDAERNRAIGRSSRARGITPDSRFYREIAELARERRIRLKVNTVVTRLNVYEDMTELISGLSPERWKLLQALPVAGQNDGKIDGLIVNHAQFDAFVRRHALLAASGLAIVPEHHDEIRGSYAMIDPAGRFFDSASGTHRYSTPILTSGVEAAFAEVDFDSQKFVSRGGEYNFAQKKAPLIGFVGLSGAGKDTAASIAIDLIGGTRIAFADPIKHEVKRRFGLNDAQLWGDKRDVIAPGFEVTPREIYSLFGRAERDRDRLVWIRAWRESVLAELERGQAVVCTDVRTLAEAAELKRLGGLLFHIERDQSASGFVDANESELAEAVARYADAAVDNNHGVAQLRDRLTALLVAAPPIDLCHRLTPSHTSRTFSLSGTAGPGRTGR